MPTSDPVAPRATGAARRLAAGGTPARRVTTWCPRRDPWRLLMLTAALTVTVSATLGQLLPPPIPEKPQYDLEVVDIYGRLYPEQYEAEIIAVCYLLHNATGPVILRCDGNFKWLKITDSTQKNLAFDYQPPYFHLYNLEPGAHDVTFTYRVRHDSFTPGGGVIAPNRLQLGPGCYWYPRNIASDPHLVQLNLDTDPDYPVTASPASQTRDLLNNLLRLRTWLMRKPTIEGLILTGGTR